MTLNGYPFVNYAMNVRGTATTTGVRTRMILPRNKFTYVAQFIINPSALSSPRVQTNLSNFLRTGRMYARLRRIDHPKVEFDIETIRRYNKYVKLYKTTKFGAAQMVFHDDRASIVAALWKEYLAFYTYGGGVGADIVTAGGSTANLNQDFRRGVDLVGSNVRTNMETNPSVGRTLRGDGRRHFFDTIIVYDLGVDPDRINIYYFVQPVLTGLDHENLDTWRRTDFVGMTMPFEYENYFRVIGANSSLAASAIANTLGQIPERPIRGEPGHARMLSVQGVPAQTIPQTLSQTSDGNRINSIVNDPTRFVRNPPIQTEQLPATAVLAQQQGFDLPDTAAETQQHLDAVNSILNDPSLAPGADLNQLNLYGDLLQNHLNNLNGQAQAGQLQSYNTSAVRDAAASTLEVFG